MKGAVVLGFLFALIATASTPAWASRHQLTSTVPTTIDVAAVPAYPLEAKHQVVRRVYRPRLVTSVRREHHNYSHPTYHPKPAPAKNIAVASVPPSISPPSAPQVDPPSSGDYVDGITTPLPKVIRSRPRLLEGNLEIAGKTFKFASGGTGWSIPYGTFEVTPTTVGSWGARHDAVGLANDSIYDRQLGRDRDGIEMHASPHFTSAGCVVVDRWAEFKRTLFAFIDGMGHAFLHVGPSGAIITAAKASPLPPMIYLAERVKEAPVARRRYVGLTYHHHAYYHWRTHYAGG